MFCGKSKTTKPFSNHYLIQSYVEFSIFHFISNIFGFVQNLFAVSIERIINYVSQCLTIYKIVVIEHEYIIHVHNINTDLILEQLAKSSKHRVFVAWCTFLTVRYFSF